MSKKKPIYVNIPVDYVCVKLSDLLQKQYYLDAREHEAAYIRHELYKVQDENENLKKQLSEADKKIEELQRDFETRSDAMVYWNKEYEKLKKKLQELTDGGSGNAEAEKT